MRAVLPQQYTPHQAISYISKTRIQNVFDTCLADERQLWNEIIARGLDRVCCPKGRAPYNERPYIIMPDSGRRFKATGSVPISAATFTNDSHVVLNEEIAVGYDGVIDTVILNVVGGGASGTGFVEGSGTLSWRVATTPIANPRYLKDLGNVQFSYGSLLNPTPVMNSGWRVYSGNVLTVSVVFAPSGAGVLNPAATVVCSLGGWIYSR